MIYILKELDFHSLEFIKINNLLLTELLLKCLWINSNSQLNIFILELCLMKIFLDLIKQLIGVNSHKLFIIILNKVFSWLLMLMFFIMVLFNIGWVEIKLLIQFQLLLMVWIFINKLNLNSLININHSFSENILLLLLLIPELSLLTSHFSQVSISVVVISTSPGRESFTSMYILPWLVYLMRQVRLNLDKWSPVPHVSTSFSWATVVPF